MEHFDYIEWVFYKEKVFSKEKLNKMEEHLYICGECMDIFLSLIDKREEDEAQEIIPADFTNRIMDNIEDIEYMPRTREEKSNTKFKDIFIYYVAVASVAIVLTLGGFYSGMVDLVPKVSSSTAANQKINPPNLIFNVSQKIVNRTSNFINNFEISSIKEETK